MQVLQRGRAQLGATVPLGQVNPVVCSVLCVQGSGDLASKACGLGRNACPDWTLRMGAKHLCGSRLNRSGPRRKDEHLRMSGFRCVTSGAPCLPWPGRVWCMPPGWWHLLNTAALCQLQVPFTFAESAQVALPWLMSLLGVDGSMVFYGVR